MSEIVDGADHVQHLVRLKIAEEIDRIESQVLAKFLLMDTSTFSTEPYSQQLYLPKPKR